MSEQKMEAKAAGSQPKAKKVKPEFGPDRAYGVAGPEGSYVEKSLSRWRLRGDGVQR